MGQDAMIYFQSKKDFPDLEWGFLEEHSVKKAPSYSPEGATHQIHLFGNDRYYGEGYERGVWPRLASILLELFASRDVERVWYGGDGNDYVDEITPDRVLELSKHYMVNGCRPYRGYKKKEEKKS